MEKINNIIPQGDGEFILKQLQELNENNFIYTPNEYTFLIFINYILSKRNVQLLLPSGKYLNKQQRISDLFINWNCDKKLKIRNLSVPKFYKNSIKKFIRNKHQRFIAFPLVMYHSKNCNQYIEEKMSHMTLVIYDKKYKLLERFDSANHTSYDTAIIDVVIFNVFKSLFNLQIDNYITPQYICPIGGLQYLQEYEVTKYSIAKILGGNIGLCSIHSLIYLDKRLKYPNKKSNEIVEMIINDSYKNKISLTKMIITYMNELVKIKGKIQNQLEIKYSITETIKKLENTNDLKNLSVLKLNTIKTILKMYLQK